MGRTMTYEKDGGLNYPVKVGEIWGSDDIQIKCSDLEGNLNLPWDLPDFVYCDPPWTPSLASGFRSKAGLEDKANFNTLMSSIILMVQLAKNGFVVEIGNQYVDMLVSLFDMKIRDNLVIVDGTYYKTKPMKYIGSDDRVLKLNGSDDENSPEIAIIEYTDRGDLVCDPCTGRGLTPQVCAKLERRFWGVELNPYRISCALTKLKNMGLEIKKYD